MPADPIQEESSNLEPEVMGLLTLNLKWLKIPRREDAQNLWTTVDIVTTYNDAEVKIQTGNVHSGGRYILFNYYPDHWQFRTIHLCGLYLD